MAGSSAAHGRLSRARVGVASLLRHNGTAPHADFPRTIRAHKLRTLSSRMPSAPEARTMPRALSLTKSMTFAYGVPSPVSPGVVRLTANNPSVLTFTGTNTYLVGSTALAVIDPGPDDDAHRAAILSVAGGRPITHIVITHAHR